MKTTTEIEIRIPETRIVQATVLNNGNCKLIIEEKAIPTKLSSMFKLIEASKLSLNDDFMQYKVCTDRECQFKQILTETIKNGISDFYIPICSPSFNKDETGIVYEIGQMPAVGKPYPWWLETAKKFCPEMNSALGNDNEYVAFLGVLIKRLMAERWTIKRAWDAICNNSEIMGHCWNPKAQNHDIKPTGSDPVLGVCDLMNVYKILVDRKGNIVLGSGCCFDDGTSSPLSNIKPAGKLFTDGDDYATGWIVCRGTDVKVIKEWSSR